MADDIACAEPACVGAAQLPPAADRYLHAKAITLAVLDSPPDRREQALAKACAGDCELLGEVRWLLDAAEDGAHDAQRPLTPVDPMDAGDIHLEAPLPRDYRVLRRIGQGGMGVVYLAERVDGELRQRVALKLLHALPGRDALSQRRFATERRILSSLNHPNIAHLIDGGVSAAGRPFLAMEHVAGERIDAWCDQHGLNLRQRITLFLKVCDAVEHAHRRLVIHRDIKPSNILVNDAGEPKLLDFGIARLLDGEEAEHTRTELRALTLAYASPEQIEGGPLATASDVYSLGVLLYQLVTGVRPFDHFGTAHRQQQAIVDGTVMPPGRRLRENSRSAAAADSAVRQRVPADLDAVVLKAMRREPQQRYASASALAADLRRFLLERPVRARRGHLGYRLQRFAWRRRWALAAAVAVMVAATMFSMDRLRQHARMAAERDRATAVVHYMDALYQNTDALHLRGEDVSVRQMLDLGAASLRQRADLSPEHQAALLVATGRAYNALGLAQDAVPLLEQASAILAHTDASAEQRASLSLALAAAYSGSRRLIDAMAADAAALKLLQDAPQPDADEIAQATIRLLHNHAVTLDLPPEQVREQLQTVLTQLDARPDAPPELKIAAYRALAMAYGSDPRGALDAAEQAMRIAADRYPPDDPRLLPTRSVYLSAVQQSDPQRALALLPDLIADHERRMGDSARVAALLGNLGSILIRLGKTGESLPVFARALAMARKVSGQDSQLYRLTAGNFAAAQLALGNGAAATALIETVLPGLQVAAQTEGATEAQVFLASARQTLAEAAVLRGDRQGAQQQLALAADGLSRIERSAYPQMYAAVLLRLAQLQQQSGASADSARTLDTLDTLIAEHADAASSELRSGAASLRIALVSNPVAQRR